MSDDPVEVVEVKPEMAEGRVGAFACDPTYRLPDVHARGASSAPPLGPASGPPSAPPDWGELGESVRPHSADADPAVDAQTSSEEPETLELQDLTLDLGAEQALASKVPVEFDMVAAPDIELDLPTSPAAQGAMSPAPAGVGPNTTEPVQRRQVFVEGKFYERLPFAFIAPFLGQGWILLIISALAPACVAMLLSLDVGLVARVSFLVPALLFSIGLLTEAFARLAQAGAENDEGLPAPTLGDTQLRTVLGAGIATVFIAALLFVLPAYLFFRQHISVGLFSALAFLPYVYWPMSLTVQGLTGDVVAGLDMPLVFRSMLRAPVKYFVVVVLGFALTLALSIGSAFVVGALMVSAGPSRILVFGATFIFFGTMTYLHGALGYAMGRLVATEDKLAIALSHR